MLVHSLATITFLTLICCYIYFEIFQRKHLHKASFPWDIFSTKKHHRSEVYTLWAIFSFSTVAFFVSTYYLINDFDNSVLSIQSEPYYPLGNLNISWIPLAMYVASIFRRKYRKSTESLALNKLVSTQVRKFLSRNHSRDKARSTTIGLITANFMIDHDPNENMK